MSGINIHHVPIVIAHFGKTFEKPPVADVEKMAI